MKRIVVVIGGCTLVMAVAWLMLMAGALSVALSHAEDYYD